MGARYHTIAFSQPTYRWEGHIHFELLLATSLASPGNFAPIALHCNYLMVLVVKENVAMMMTGIFGITLFHIGQLPIATLCHDSPEPAYSAEGLTYTAQPVSSLPRNPRTRIFLLQ